VLGVLSLAAAACSSEIDAGSGMGGPGTVDPGASGSTDGTAGPTTGTGGAATTGTTGIANTTGGATDGGIPPDPSTCVPGVPPTSQIPRLLNSEYDNVVYDLLGVSTLTSSGLPPSSLLNDDFEGTMNNYAWNAYLDAADKIATEVVSGANRARFMACDPAAVATCYEDTIRTFGRKAFRRPMTGDEVARFMTLTTAQPAGTPSEITYALLYAFLASPSFISVPELATDVEGTAYKLSAHEVATRLSLTLWGSVPDDTLNMAADNGELATKEQILAQAQRMLGARDKAGPQIAAAHRTYLGMEGSIAPNAHWWKVEQDQTKFPAYTPAAKSVMAAELDAFFEEVAYTGGSFKDLLLSNIAFVNQQTAPFYGLDAAQYGAELTPVTLDATQRPGFLTRAGFLTSFSNFDATSPILRGAFITVNVIGADPGAPNPDVINTPIPPGEYTTRREQIEALTSPPACAECHGIYVNPPGFVMETFDAIGNIQTVDQLGGAINPSATVTFSDGNAKTINTPLELMQEIANTPKAKRIYTENMVSYFTGRLPNGNDACTVDLLEANLTVDGYSVLNLIADLTQADSFRLRTVGN
jgi:hypothetical protein